MPFFERSKDFNVNGGEMNDVAGNFTKNSTTSNTHNVDSNNTNIGSRINRGTEVSQNMNIGSSQKKVVGPF